MRRWQRLLLVVSLPALVGGPLTGTAAASPIPSKTAAGQSLAEREADLAAVREVLADDEVAAAIARHGFSREEVDQRLARLAPEELRQLAGQVDQIQAAGINVPHYIWILLAVFLAVLILAAIF